MRRPNFTALFFSALLVASGALAALRAYPVIPALGSGPGSAGSSAGIAREAPTFRTGCRSASEAPHGGYRFLPQCAGQAGSADGALFVVKNAGHRAGVGLVRGGSGESLADLETLDDGRAFTLFWSPRGHRFFANQSRADERERFRLFEVRGVEPVEQPALEQAALAAFAMHYPRVARPYIAVSGVRWAPDSRRIVLLAYARPGSAGSWRPLWLIGDADRGTIDPASIRARAGRDPLPSDGPYAGLAGALAR